MTEMSYPHDKNVIPPHDKNVIPPHDKNVIPPHDKNVIQTDQDITDINKQQKETEKDKETVFFPDDKPIEKQEDATVVFQKAREYWNGRGLKPECRNLFISPADLPDILRTFQHYTWDEIKNAIGNFHWHRTEAGPEFNPPWPYGSLYGFLKTGVERYFDDNALDQQFKKGG